MIVVNCPQGSAEWHDARRGAITASMFAIARSRLKTGKNAGDFTEAAKKYARRLAYERVTTEVLDLGFQTWAMKRGHELEPAAREAHEVLTGVVVQRCGVILTDDHAFGASADGLIGTDGGSEYKCLVDPEQLTAVFDDDLSDFADQVQGCMWLSGRKWWHFGVYCPGLIEIGKELTVWEWQRNDDYIETMEIELLEFKALVDRNEAELRSDSKPALRMAA